jgi:predicted  nucleic acid-binding Zn-ribbon protein
MLNKLNKLQSSFRKTLKEAEGLKQKLQDERVKVSDHLLSLEDQHNKLTQEVRRTDAFISNLTKLIGG